MTLSGRLVTAASLVIEMEEALLHVNQHDVVSAFGEDVTGFEWASGFFYNPVPPELAARSLSRGGQV
jgi:hypothetical protein